MKYINRVALDIGNVLCYVDFSDFYRELAIQGICDNIADSDRFVIDIQSPLDLGLYNLDQALRIHFPKINKEQIKKLQEAWLTVVRPCSEVLDVVDDALKNGTNIALLSNIGYDHANYLSDTLNKQFDKCIKHFSCDVGARKPTKLFYQSFVFDNQIFSEIQYFAQSNWVAHRGLFLDDKEENVKAAKSYMDSKIFNLFNYSNGKNAAIAFKKILSDI